MPVLDAFDDARSLSFAEARKSVMLAYAVVDAVILADEHILLIQRRKWPCAGQWALPGGKMEDIDESLEMALIREVREETGLTLTVSPQQLVGVYSQFERDPRDTPHTRYISTAYRVELAEMSEPVAGDDAALAQWFRLEALPLLIAFDHEQIIRDALSKRGVYECL